jgi:hypothetical protein
MRIFDASLDPYLSLSISISLCLHLCFSLSFSLCRVLLIVGTSWGARFETITDSERWHVINGNPEGAVAYDLDSANVTHRRLQVERFRHSKGY